VTGNSFAHAEEARREPEEMFHCQFLERYDMMEMSKIIPLVSRFFVFLDNAGH